MFKISALAIIGVGIMATAFFGSIGAFVARTIGELARVVGGT